MFVRALRGRLAGLLATLSDAWPVGRGFVLVIVTATVLHATRRNGPVVFVGTFAGLTVAAILVERGIRRFRSRRRDP